MISGGGESVSGGEYFPFILAHEFWCENVPGRGGAESEMTRKAIGNFPKIVSRDSKRFPGGAHPLSQEFKDRISGFSKEGISHGPKKFQFFTILKNPLNNRSQFSVAKYSKRVPN